MPDLTIVDGDRPLRIAQVGNLTASENEGGYTADRIEVGGVEIAELIAKLFGVELNDRGSLCGDKSPVDFGLVRITILRLE